MTLRCTICAYDYEEVRRYVWELSFLQTGDNSGSRRKEVTVTARSKFKTFCSTRNFKWRIRSLYFHYTEL